jgi:hypothetical protein
MALGRPSKYDPSYCEIAISIMEQGLSKTCVAAELRVARSTLYEWIDNYPDFRDAMKIGEVLAPAAIERESLQAAKEGRWNAGLCWHHKNLSQTQGEDAFKDRRETELVSPEGEAIQLNVTEIRNADYRPEADHASD